MQLAKHLVSLLYNVAHSELESQSSRTWLRYLRGCKALIRISRILRIFIQPVNENLNIGYNMILMSTLYPFQMRDDGGSTEGRFYRGFRGLGGRLVIDTRKSRTLEPVSIKASKVKTWRAKDRGYNSEIYGPILEAK